MNITAEGPGLSSGIAGQECRFTINPQDKPTTGLIISFEGPTKPEPRVKHTEDGLIEVVYTPKAGGQYNIFIRYDGKDIIGSPFKCAITGDEQIHKKLLEKVKVTGPNLRTGKINQDNQIILDCREAGIIGGISFAIEGPDRVDAQFKSNEDGTISLVYNPPKPGEYKMHLKFNDLYLTGCPYTVNVEK